MSVLKHKALIITGILIALLIAIFWMGSRYPALDEKALMGGETQLTAIGFDTLVQIPQRAEPWAQIPYHTINWLYTNWRGMAFGLLLGALLLTLLPLIRHHAVENPFANSLLGILTGSPLGVCVNCATPIAQGIVSAGGRTELALATMFSSPTLNIIVLTMLFSLLPTYMAVIKIGLTMLFIVLVIPLLMRLLRIPAFAHLNSPHQPAFEEPFSASAMDSLPDTWCEAAVWVSKRFGRNLGYIIKITVPLMILAGALGSAVVTLVPLESLATLLPTGGRWVMLISMIGVAILGVFLPVPMAFDVIVTVVLWQAGLPIQYAMILLFTLGIFSIYPFFLIWQTISKIGALGFFVVLSGLGVVAGVVAHQYHQWDQLQQQQLITQRFSKLTQAPAALSIDRSQQGQRQSQLVPLLQERAFAAESYVEQAGLRMTRLAFAPKSQAGAQQFSRVEGSQFGIKEHDNFSIQKFSLPFAQSRSIAAGDVHNDGWPDLVISSDVGLGLYANMQGKGYQQQRLDIPQINKQFVGAVALIDLNNDGWLDLFVSTYGAGSYVITNQQGHFNAENLRLIPNQKAAILANALAFGDIDKNGELDIVMGNLTVGNTFKDASIDAARNIWLRQSEQKFELVSLPAVAGETLTTLLTDLNQDGWLDLIVGNDFRPPDIYYLNDGQGNFEMVTYSDGMIPHTGNTTMSLTSADIDNDLVPEIFLAQKAWANDFILQPQPPEVVCGDIDDNAMQQNCVRMLHFRDTLLKAQIKGTVFDCLPLATTELQNGCLALKIAGNAGFQDDPRQCDSLSPGWPLLAEICRHNFAAMTQPSAAQLADGIPPIFKRNSLFVRDEAGNYQDKASAFGLQFGGWAWNAKFADLDNDGWQDLYIVTGDLIIGHRHLDYLFHNQQGKGFKNIAREAGLHSYLDTASYTYTDLDNDGDLDLVTVPVAGPVAVYINNSQSGNAILIGLRDHIGNRFGIGSTIKIYYGDGQQQMREIQASGGYLSFDAPWAHFGLGQHQQIKRMEIRWSTGEVSLLQMTFSSGAKYTITRPAGVQQ